MEEVLSQAEKEIKENKVPLGYIPIELSTKGKYGAPKKFHIRSFSAAEVASLSLSENEDLPINTCKFLQNIIFEKDVNIMHFHPNEVVEMLLIIYKTFYQNKLSLEYKPDEDDIDTMRVLMNNDIDFQNWKTAVINNKQKYTLDIPLDGLKYYEISDPAPKTILVKKQNGFSARFTYPRYGDLLVVKKALDLKFKEKDKQYEKPYAIYKRYKESEERLMKGEDINLGNIPKLPKAEIDKLKEYENEKLNYSAYLVKGLHLIELNGKDISDLSLTERAELASQEVNIDHPTFVNVSDFFTKKIKVGPVETFKIKSPVTGKEKDFNYPFREYDILAALKDFSPEVGGTVYEIE